MSRTFIEREKVRAYVADNAGCGVDEIAAAVRKTPGAVRMQLARLAASGHVTRQQDGGYVCIGSSLMPSRPSVFANVSSIFGAQA